MCVDRISDVKGRRVTLLRGPVTLVRLTTYLEGPRRTLSFPVKEKKKERRTDLPSEPLSVDPGTSVRMRGYLPSRGPSISDPGLRSLHGCQDPTFENLKMSFLLF